MMKSRIMDLFKSFSACIHESNNTVQKFLKLLLRVGTFAVIAVFRSDLLISLLNPLNLD